MRIIEVRNVHAALPTALDVIRRNGVLRGSRNGEVLVMPEPVVTIYRRPTEKVVFYPERDFNVAFCVYEALWMLAGRDDLRPLQRYIKRFGEFSDDGVTLHAAYGRRWRLSFGQDQLKVIATRLQRDRDDRRSVLQMWDTKLDLGSASRDVPCNVTATLQVNVQGQLELNVFNRSNDILWGAYFANAFQFGTLLEYMANWIGVEVGPYRQLSMNWHAYTATLGEYERLTADPNNVDPYSDDTVWTPTMPGDIAWLDARIRDILIHVDTDFSAPQLRTGDRWLDSCYAVLKAHWYCSRLPAPERYERAYTVLAMEDPSVDVIYAMRQWVERRQETWRRKLSRE